MDDIDDRLDRIDRQLLDIIGTMIDKIDRWRRIKVSGTKKRGFIFLKGFWSSSRLDPLNQITRSHVGLP
ncbi:hypothetical protein PJP14_29590, partial [Mycobacterium kansasii]